MKHTDPFTKRLTTIAVSRLERLLGGDPVVEGLVLQFIDHKYQARSLFFIPDTVADEIFKRPDAFLKAAKKFDPNTPF